MIDPDNKNIKSDDDITNLPEAALDELSDNEGGEIGVE